MSLFGEVYPREQSSRIAKLPELAIQLSELTDRFYDSLPSDEEFDAACEELLANSME